MFIPSEVSGRKLLQTRSRNYQAQTPSQVGSVPLSLLGTVASIEDNDDIIVSCLIQKPRCHL